MLIEPRITGAIIKAAIEVHRTLGPGLLESAYEECLCHELQACSVPFARQVELPVVYKNVELSCSYRIDVLVGNAVVLELKAVDRLQPVHEAQLTTYLRLSGKRVGLLMNFNVAVMKEGIVRRVL